MQSDFREPPKKEKLPSDVPQTYQAPHVRTSTFFSSLFLFLFVNLSTMGRNSYSMESETHGGWNCPCADTHVATKPIFVYLYIFVTSRCGNSKACQLKRNIPFMFIFDIEFKYNSVDLLQIDVWLVLLWACICGVCIVSPQAINKDLFCCLHRSKCCLFYNVKNKKRTPSSLTHRSAWKQAGTLEVSPAAIKCQLVSEMTCISCFHVMPCMWCDGRVKALPAEKSRGSLLRFLN